MYYVSADIEGLCGFAGGQTRAQQDEILRSYVVLVCETIHQASGQGVALTSFHGFPETLPDFIQPIRQRKPGEFDLPSLDGSFDGLVMMGFHGLGPDYAFGHSYRYEHLWLNGVKCGEVAIQILLAASKGVPLALLIGDSGAVAEAQAFAPSSPTICIRAGMEENEGPLTPDIADSIRQEIQQAVAAKGRIPLPPMPAQYHLQIPMRNELQARLAEKLPYGVKRDGLVVGFTSGSFEAVYRFLLDTFACCDQARIMHA